MQGRLFYTSYTNIVYKYMCLCCVESPHYLMFVKTLLRSLYIMFYLRYECATFSSDLSLCHEAQHRDRPFIGAEKDKCEYFSALSVSRVVAQIIGLARRNHEATLNNKNRISELIIGRENCIEGLHPSSNTAYFKGKRFFFPFLI